MRVVRATVQPQTVVKTYGRGSVLGLLSPIMAALMAAVGMNGWQQAAIRQMEQDAVAMSRRGYRIASTREFGIPLFGMTWYQVTYERDRQGEAAAG